MERFESLHSKILEHIKKNRSCMEGYMEVYQSTTITEISKIIKMYWEEVLGMHLESSLVLFSDFFADFQEEFNKNGIYFNQDATEGYALVYNGKVKIEGNAKVRSFGESEIDITGKASLIAFGASKINAFGESSVILKEQSTAMMFDQCDVRSFDHSSVICQGGKTLILSDYSKASAFKCGGIHGYGNTEVTLENEWMRSRVFLSEKSA